MKSSKNEKFPTTRQYKVGFLVICRVESVQDFLIKLDMKPCMHFVKISIFFITARPQDTRP